LVTGLALGAAAAVAYSVQTGRDLRDEFEAFRGDFTRRDFEAMSNRFESRITELGAQLEERMTQVRDKASETAEAAGGAAGDVAADVVATAEAKVDEAAPA
jgi:gas vesicle protein